MVRHPNLGPHLMKVILIITVLQMTKFFDNIIGCLSIPLSPNSLEVAFPTIASMMSSQRTANLTFRFQNALQNRSSNSMNLLCSIIYFSSAFSSSSYQSGALYSLHLAHINFLCFNQCSPWSVERSVSCQTEHAIRNLRIIVWTV